MLRGILRLGLCARDSSILRRFFGWGFVLGLCRGFGSTGVLGLRRFFEGPPASGISFHDQVGTSDGGQRPCLNSDFPPRRAWPIRSLEKPMKIPLHSIQLAILFSMATTVIGTRHASAEENKEILSRIEDPKSVKDHFLNNLLKAANEIEQCPDLGAEQKNTLKSVILAQASDSKQSNAKAIVDEKSNAAMEIQLQQKDSQSLKEARRQILEKVLPTAQGVTVEASGSDEYKEIVKSCLNSAIRGRAEQLGVVTAKPTEAKSEEDLTSKTIKKARILEIPASNSKGNFALLKSPKSIKDIYVNCLLEEAASKVVVDRKSGDIPALLWQQAYYCKSNNDLALIDPKINTILEKTLRDHGLKATLNKLEFIKAKLLPKIHNYPESKESMDDITSSISTSIMRGCLKNI